MIQEINKIDYFLFLFIITFNNLKITTLFWSTPRPLKGISQGVFQCIQNYFPNQNKAN